MDSGVMPQLSEKKCRQAGGIFLLILKKKTQFYIPRRRMFQKQLRNSKNMCKKEIKV